MWFPSRCCPALDILHSDITSIIFFYFFIFLNRSTFNYWLQLCCTIPTHLKCLASSNRVLLTSGHLVVVLRWPFLPQVWCFPTFVVSLYHHQCVLKEIFQGPSAVQNKSTCRTHLLWLLTRITPIWILVLSINCSLTMVETPHEKKRVGTCVFVCACDCLNLSYTRELQSLNFSEQYVSNPSKQLALHLEHTRIRGLI